MIAEFRGGKDVMEPISTTTGVIIIVLGVVIIVAGGYAFGKWKGWW